MRILLAILGLALCRVEVAAEPTLTKEQVAEIGQAVLNTSQYRKYRDGFDRKKPHYHPETRMWSFPATGRFFPVTLGSPTYFFEVRDTDGQFRIGSVSHKGKLTPRTSDKFRMPPDVKKRLGEALREELHRRSKKANKDAGGNGG